MKFPILTALQGNNADLFADIAQLYIPSEGLSLDMTWGLGNFWKKTSRKVIGIDAVTPTAHIVADLRHLPFKSSSFDAVVLDPPYAKRVGTSIKASIAQPYQLDNAISPTGHIETTSLYMAGATEALRVLKARGVLIIKCQDEIESGKQRFNHVNYLSLPGYVCEDLFVMMQSSIPAMREPYQLHARKNHSYFIVHRKKK